MTVEAPPAVSLRVDDVHKAFGDNAVLRGVELEVGNHEVVTLIGASGSGKSTLLRCIDLLEPIDAGAILLDGVDISWPGYDANDVRRKVGIVFQSFNLFPHLSVLNNVTLAPRKVLKESRSDAEHRGRESAAAVRAGGQGRRLPRPAVRWSAAASGDRSRAGDGTEDHAVRRDHVGARSRTGR